MNGQTVRQRGESYIVQQSGVEIELFFAKGFDGQFDAFSVAAAPSEPAPSATVLSREVANDVLALLSPLVSLASGGDLAGPAFKSGRALQLAIAAQNSLAKLGAFATSTSPRRSLSGGGLLFNSIA